MKNKISTNWDLKVLAILGFIGMMAIMILPVFLRYLSVKHSAGQQKELLNKIYNQPLGELGSYCGGEERLPCKPGLECINDKELPPPYGKCVEAAGVELSTNAEKLAELDQPCSQGGVSPVCAAGLYCQKINKQEVLVGACKKIDETAPFISSVKVDAMQPIDQGGYQAPAGTKAMINIQTVNVVSLKAGFKTLNATEYGPSIELDEVKVEDGGRYSVAFMVTKNLKGKILLTATAKNGDVTWLMVPVAAIE